MDLSPLDPSAKRSASPTPENSVRLTAERGLSNNQLVGYLVATFSISWTLWALAAAVSSGAGDSLRPVYFLPGTLAPGVVGLWFVARCAGPRALSDLTGRLFITTVKARWYLFALGYMILVKLIVALIYRATESAWPAFNVLPWYLPFAIVISTVAQAGEEVGWRGVVLPPLMDHMGTRLGSIALGVVWAVWHIPLFVIADTDLSGQSFWAFLMGVTALSVSLAWLYIRSGGSLLLVMLMHAAVNNTAQLVPSNIPGTSVVDHRVAWLTAIVLWAGAFAILRLMPSQTSPGAIGLSRATA